MVKPRAEELWSYLIGLAPVGQTVSLGGHLSEDLNMKRTFVAVCATELVNAGVIKRTGPGLCIVLQRIGPMREKRRKPVDDSPVLHPRVTESSEPRNPILPPPLDTRDMTARMFGDPLPGRSALDRRAVHA